MTRFQPHNAATVTRETLVYLRQRWGVRTYVEAKRCPGCGAKSFQRNPSTGVCRVCLQKASQS